MAKYKASEVRETSTISFILKLFIVTLCAVIIVALICFMGFVSRDHKTNKWFGNKDLASWTITQIKPEEEKPDVTEPGEPIVPNFPNGDNTVPSDEDDKITPAPGGETVRPDDGEDGQLTPQIPPIASF